MVRDVAHVLFRLSLMVSQLLSGSEVPSTAIAYKCRWIISFVLLDNVLPIIVSVGQANFGTGS